MSFRCEICGEAQPSRARPTRLVIKKKEKAYPSGAVGFEIMSEKVACESCANVPFDPTVVRNGNILTA
jgi:hypothetical protein